jgi:excisionase family DNA binding protein
MSELLTTKQLAEKLQLSYSMVWKMIRNKEIPYILVGKNYRFEYDKVMDQLKKNTADKAESKLPS